MYRTLNRTLVVVVLGIMLGAIQAAAAADGPKPPPARKIPGVTEKDQFPRGCVDCHVNMPDRKMDTRISTLMKQWQQGVEPALLERVKAFTPASIALKGKHPKAESALSDIPNGCLKCHSRTSKFAPAFAQLLHGLHLTGGEKNHFLTLFQGECTHCHKLDTKTGTWSFASGKEP